MRRFLLFLGASVCGLMSALAAEPLLDVEARKRERLWIWESPRPVDPPAVREAGWPRDPLDRFLLHRLESEGLRPAPPAGDRTWLRRASFGITGLPPTLREIREFLEDGGSGARERVVDRLLSSPHFGERWARHWMDLMRYAESRGHEGDYAIANAWQYRDYLIRAFNADVPYDQFLKEHLAGDLMTPPRLRPGTEINESVLGTGWAYLGEENHSPVDIRQDECERLDNKLDVFTKSFLGLTVSCARCHDHKFDPIRAQDYYALTGFFLGSSYRQVRFESMENHRRMAAELRALREQSLPPLAGMLAAAAHPALTGLPRYLLAAADVAFGDASCADRASRDSLDARRLQLWTQQLREAATNRLHALHAFAVRAGRGPGTNESPEPPEPAVPDGLRILADFGDPSRQPWKADGEAFGTGPVQPGDLLPGTGANRPIAGVAVWGAARRDAFWNRLSLAPGNEDDSGRLAATARSGQMVRTPSFVLKGGRLHYLIRGRSRVYAAVDSHLMLEGPLHGVLTQKFDTGHAPEPQWVTHDLSAYSGHRTHVEFGPDGDAGLEVLMVVEYPSTPMWKPWFQSMRSAGPEQSLDELAIETAHRAGLAASWLEARTQDASMAVPEFSVLLLADWLLRNPELLADPGPRFRLAAQCWREGEEAIAGRTTWTSHTALAWFDGTGVDENVLVRGKPSKLGPVAPRSLPAAFPAAKPIQAAGSSGRRELAEQLTAPDNPLVARVLVNRVWHHLFGRGLVATVDNFGALGESPTHPELLDYLAWTFVHEDRWSLKRLVRRLVLSQAYTMSSRPEDPQALARDPANRWWHHIPVRRLEAEAIRDALLTVSGRLNPALGGPPVPLYLNEFTVGRGRPEKSGPLDGDGRRSLYLPVRRNFLPVTLQSFDAPTPFSTVGRRNVTNVPGQALALMNDPLFHQQARVWVDRMLSENPAPDPLARIGWLFESAYGRPPTPAEVSACLESFAELEVLRGVGTDPVEVWTDLAHALLNANEFLYLM